MSSGGGTVLLCIVISLVVGAAWGTPACLGWTAGWVLGVIWASRAAGRGR